MRLLLVAVGRGRTPWADQACADYTRRLPSQLKLSEERIRPEPFKGDVETVRLAESERVLALLRPTDLLVAIDERGACPDSHGFARWIEEASQRGTTRLVLALGGPYGHHQVLRDKAWRVLALSSMVTNHEIARVMLTEQLYRASTLLWGGSYHH